MSGPCKPDEGFLPLISGTWLKIKPGSPAPAMGPGTELIVKPRLVIDGGYTLARTSSGRKNTPNVMASPRTFAPPVLLSSINGEAEIRLINIVADCRGVPFRLAFFATSRHMRTSCRWQKFTLERATDVLSTVKDSQAQGRQCHRRAAEMKMLDKTEQSDQAQTRKPESCYCSALPKGSPCLSCYKRWLASRRWDWLADQQERTTESAQERIGYGERLPA